MTRVQAELINKIRIIRSLDFTQGQRVDATYQEHGKLPEAEMLPRSDIEQSKLELSKITLHLLHLLHEAQGLS